MKEAKQVIVVRKDLGMSRGKMAAQVAHASMGCILKDKQFNEDGNIVIDIMNNSALHTWLNGMFTKIVLAVEDEKELMEIYNTAISINLNVVLITDAGLTEFEGPTNTCIGIGPHFPEAFENVTGHLKTFR